MFMFNVVPKYVPSSETGSLVLVVSKRKGWV